MNIINRICEKYKTDYNVMNDEWTEPVHLVYGEQIPAEFRRRMEQELGRVDVELNPAGMVLKLDMDSEGIYRLSQSGELLYRFANRAPSFYFPDYDAAEAIAWTIYAIVTENEAAWFRAAQGKMTRGKFISCESFSARQQAVASRIMKSVRAQSVNEVSAEKVDEVLKKIMIHADQFTESIPLFSYRPIPESAYREYRGRTVEKELGEIAEDLFGNGSFEKEIMAYRELVKQKEDYSKQVAKARKELTRVIYELPILAVRRFFTELDVGVDGVTAVSMHQIEELLDRSVRFSLTAERLRSVFAEVDKAYADYAGMLIRQDFVRQVCEETRLSIDAEHLAARNAYKQMKRDLTRFCFVEEASFRQDEEECLLNWSQLVNLQDRDLAMPDLNWDVDSLIQLQRTILKTEEPNCWLCTPHLRARSQQAQKTDQFNTQPAPLMDEKYVIAIWARDILV